MGLESHADAFPHQLSGGMQQRVAIARAYVLKPEVLLMDEPFGALDAQTRVVMQEELVRLARINPRTVLFITHSVEEAVYLADRVVIMTRRPGRIKESIDIKSISRSRELEPGSRKLKTSWTRSRSYACEPRFGNHCARRSTKAAAQIRQQPKLNKRRR